MNQFFTTASVVLLALGLTGCLDGRREGSVPYDRPGHAEVDFLTTLPGMSPGFDARYPEEIAGARGRIDTESAALLDDRRDAFGSTRSDVVRSGITLHEYRGYTACSRIASEGRVANVASEKVERQSWREELKEGCRGFFGSFL